MAQEEKKVDEYSEFYVNDEDDIYYESQELKTDTCFQHALNMYFQQEYVTHKSFKDLYCKTLTKYKDKIMEIKKLNSKLSFYGKDIKIPKPNELLVESSKIEQNSDLNGYFELYAMSSVENMIESFILEFQIDLNTSKLMYVPH
eukprot:156775_1